MIRKIWTLSVLLSLSTWGWTFSSWADTTPENHFSLVQGTVKVTSGGGSVRKVAKGDSAYPGETIQVGEKAQAQVALFDGSTLDLSPNSKMTLNKLQKPDANNKVISLKLALGKVFVQVKKLFSAKSAFEIEAGGVVCGVRGTSFSMEIDGKNNLNLQVFGGTVGATSGGSTQLFTQGQGAHFANGHWDGKIVNVGNSSKGGSGSNTGKGGTGGGSSNGSSGNNSGSTSNGGSSNTGGNGTSTGESNGGTNGTGGNNEGTENPTTGSSNSSSGLDSNSCLGDLNNQFTNGILINGDNSLNTAQQNVNIHLVVPARENVP